LRRVNTTPALKQRAEIGRRLAIESTPQHAVALLFCQLCIDALGTTAGLSSSALELRRVRPIVLAVTRL